LAPALVGALERKLARNAQVFGAELAGQKFGKFNILDGAGTPVRAVAAPPAREVHNNFTGLVKPGW
jgi:hypothetical protein